MKLSNHDQFAILQLHKAAHADYVVFITFCINFFFELYIYGISQVMVKNSVSYSFYHTMEMIMINKTFGLRDISRQTEK